MSSQALRSTIFWAKFLTGFFVMQCSDGASLKKEGFVLDWHNQPSSADTILLRSFESGRYVGYSIHDPSGPAGEVAGVASATHDPDSPTSWFTVCDGNADGKPRLLVPSIRTQKEPPHRSYVVAFKHSQGAVLLTQNSMQEALSISYAQMAVQGWPETSTATAFSRLLVFENSTSESPYAAVAADRHGTLTLRRYDQKDSGYYGDPATLFIVRKLYSNDPQEDGCKGLARNRR